MDFLFTKDQDLIRKSTKEFFEKECPKDKVRELKADDKGYDPKMWKKMVELGYQGLVIPEAYGGTEGDFWDLLIFMEEMGRNIVPCPYFPTVVLCALPVMAFGTEAQKEAILPKIAEKGQIWSYAQIEESSEQEASGIAMAAALAGDDYVLSGTKLFVPYANAADKLLVVARTAESDDPEQGITVFIVDAKAEGLSCDVIPTTARDMRCMLTFDKVKVPKENVLGSPDQGWEIVDYIQQHAAVLKAAEMCGGAQAAFDISLKYCKERKQFDKPIGSFQSIQHRLVDLLTEVEGLQYVTYEAAWRISTGSPSRRLNSIAKAKANGVYHRVCYHGIVMHGAIGWTEEMDIGLYHLRTRSMIYDGGGTDLHLEKIACELETAEPDFVKLYGTP